MITKRNKDKDVMRQMGQRASGEHPQKNRKNPQGAEKAVWKQASMEGDIDRGIRLGSGQGTSSQTQ